MNGQAFIIKCANGQSAAYQGHRQKVRSFKTLEAQNIVVSKSDDSLHVWRLSDGHCLLDYPLALGGGAEAFVDNNERLLVIRDVDESAHQRVTILAIYTLSSSDVDEVDTIDIDGIPTEIGFAYDGGSLIVQGHRNSAGQHVQTRYQLSFNDEPSTVEQSHVLEVVDPIPHGLNATILY